MLDIGSKFIFVQHVDQVIMWLRQTLHSHCYFHAMKLQSMMKIARKIILIPKFWFMAHNCWWWSSTQMTQLWCVIFQEMAEMVLLQQFSTCWQSSEDENCKKNYLMSNIAVSGSNRSYSNCLCWSSTPMTQLCCLWARNWNMWCLCSNFAIVDIQARWKIARKIF